MIPRVYDVVILGNPSYNVLTEVSDPELEYAITSCSIYSGAILAKIDIGPFALIGAVGTRFRDRVVADIERLQIPEHYLIDSNGTIEVFLNNGTDPPQNLVTSINEIRIRDFPEEFLRTEFILLNPVIREIHIELMEWLSTSSDAKLLLDPRFRTVGSNGKAMMLSDHHMAEEALQFVEVVKTNKAESLVMTGEVDPFLAAEAMVEAGCGIGIVTLGSEGSIIFDGIDFFSIPAFKAATVDTTGAGDAYFAGFTKQLLDSQPLADCGAFASTIAGMMIGSPDGLNFNIKLDHVMEKSLELSEDITIR